MSFFAEAELTSRVTARILKGALFSRRFLITEPPCFPVAPVMRTVVIVGFNSKSTV